MEQDSYLVGIDFGAVNIKASAWTGKKIRPLDLNEDQMDGVETENVILYYKTEAGELDPRIGKRARQESPAAPEGDYVDDIKRKLEQKAWRQEIPCLGRTLSAEEIAKDILTVIYDKIRRKRRTYEGKITAAITVPVCFSAVQRLRIRRAAQAAGFDVQHVLTEPFAAALSQSDLLKSEKTQNVLIFDFGGSTLDVSLLAIGKTDGTLHVKEAGSAGLHLGGLDFDTWIADELLRPQLDAALEEKRIELSSLEQQKTDRALLRMAQMLKEQLFEEEDQEDDDETHTEQMPVHLDFVPLQLRRGDVIDLFKRHDVGGQILRLLDDLFEDTDLLKQQVDVVRVFGGTMHIRYFLELLAAYFPEDSFDPEACDTEGETIYTSVASGAAQILVNEQGGTAADIENHLPYQLGFLRQNGRFEPCIQHGMAVGAFSMPKRLRPGDIADGKLAIAQAFPGAAPVYVGAVPVNIDAFAGTIVLRLSVGADEAIRYHLEDYVDDGGGADAEQQFDGDVIIGEAEE